MKTCHGLMVEISLSVVAEQRIYILPCMITHDNWEITPEEWEILTEGGTHIYIYIYILGHNGMRMLEEKKSDEEKKRKESEEGWAESLFKYPAARC